MQSSGDYHIVLNAAVIAPVVVVGLDLMEVGSELTLYWTAVPRILGTAVAIVMVLATVAAGWAALILHARDCRHWLGRSRRGLSAAVLVGPPAAVAVMFAPAMVPIIPIDAMASVIREALSLVLWLAVPALLLGTAIVVPAGAVPSPGGWRWHVMGGLVWAIVILGGGWWLFVW